MKKPNMFQRRLLAVLFYLLAIVAAYAGAYLLRFDFAIPRGELRVCFVGIFVALAVKTAVFLSAGMHRALWTYASVADLTRILAANGLASLLFASANLIVVGLAFPRSVYVIDLTLCVLIIAGARFAVRLYRDAASMGKQSDTKGVLIYGAGAAGIALAREIRANATLKYRLLGFFDDDPLKAGSDIAGTPVVGSGRTAARMIDHLRRRGQVVEEIVIAMPSATGKQMREAVSNCRAAGVPCKTIPSMKTLLNGRVLADQIRNIAVTDLLGREPVRLDETSIKHHLAGRSILVTGAAGSIGSELCRQIAAYGPRLLVAFDQAESEMFRIEMELRKAYPSLNLEPIVGDIREYPRLVETIRDYEVEVVFHAAAYKHVPIMEANPLEAARNNVVGTWNVVTAATECRVSNFLMISSDKAVNPTSIMGLTKRLAELIVCAANGSGHGTKCVSVRFGNVLGSNGSVVPLFERQIATGGPVTVTHPEMRRYFMTVTEAVQLVLQAGTMGKGGEIFMLDMGEPVLILDLARQMIRLAGYEPDEDIEIRITGMRPGEKLFEELSLNSEDHLPTYHPKIRIFRGARVSRPEIDIWLERLRLGLDRRDVREVMHLMGSLVPQYQPHPSPRKKATSQKERQAAAAAS